MKESETYQNKNQDQDQEHLDENELAQYAEYLRHETDRIPERLIRHVEGCAYCRGELMAITDLLDELPDLAEEPARSADGYPLSVVRRPVFSGWRLIRTVAAVAAVVLIAWGIREMFPGQPQHEPIAQTGIKDSLPAVTPPNPSPDSLRSSPSLRSSRSSPSSPLAPDTIRYASAFVPNPAYESLVGARYRSGVDPMVSGPDPGQEFAPGDTLRLSWTPAPEEEYSLIILDNKANPVKEIKSGGASALSWKIDLKPGLYYWKFLGKEEMWKVGKIKICSASRR